MSDIESFAAETGDHPHTLILGSIPGVASLQSAQYYAHPRNAFWPIVCDYFQIDHQLSYEKRLVELKLEGVALWDVLGRCHRPGSLDSAIVQESIEVNAIDEFAQRHQSLQKILLNGGKASREFKKHFPQLQTTALVQVFELPSTSPAFAAMPFEEKKARWFEALNHSSV
jgi:hypoxanthine-DNA glycosylase